jgi:demethylmenaquinone methyltransferase/2-methoxy-6-polyprenyl-1,4-benzoquinol methylase
MVINASSSVLREQLEYYRARASEYDQWWFRQGRYDRGPELNDQWFHDIDEAAAALRAFKPSGRILELAGGTGLWSERLLPLAKSLTVVDGSPEVLAMNAARLQSAQVSYVEANLFDWESPKRFDTVFFGFWLSHVPDGMFDSFWKLVRSHLAPRGRVFFVDSRREPTSSAIDHYLPEHNSMTIRRLNDGREFRVYKVFYEPAVLTRRLEKQGWNVEIGETSRYFIYGSAQPTTT